MRIKINKEKYEDMDIDDVFIVTDQDEPDQQLVTCFYVNSRNTDKEWNFIIKLN